MFRVSPGSESRLPTALQPITDLSENEFGREGGTDLNEAELRSLPEVDDSREDVSDAVNPREEGETTGIGPISLATSSLSSSTLLWILTRPHHERDVDAQGEHDRAQHLGACDH